MKILTHCPPQKFVAWLGFALSLCCQVEQCVHLKLQHSPEQCCHFRFLSVTPYLTKNNYCMGIESEEL